MYFGVVIQGQVGWVHGIASQIFWDLYNSYAGFMVQVLGIYATVMLGLCYRYMLVLQVNWVNATGNRYFRFLQVCWVFAIGI